MTFNKFACIVGIVFGTSTCFAQMFTVTDLGTLGGSSSTAYGLNSFGQVVGESKSQSDASNQGFRTAPNTPINTGTDDLGTLGGHDTAALGIDDKGRAIGWSKLAPGNVDRFHAFRTAPNSAINPVTDDLGGYRPVGTEARGINSSGEVIGDAYTDDDTHYAYYYAFRTAPNSPINPATDALGSLNPDPSKCDQFPLKCSTLGTIALSINDSGQVVGSSNVPANPNGGSHAFRTAPNRAIDPTNDDLGTLGGTSSFGTHINAFGQVTGSSWIANDTGFHAFRTAPNGAIDANTDDLGTLGGPRSMTIKIDDYGQVVGWSSLPGDTTQHSFIYSNGAMHDLNDLIPADSGCTLLTPEGFGTFNPTVSINDAGQIAGYYSTNTTNHGFLYRGGTFTTLDDPYAAQTGTDVRQPTRRPRGCILAQPR